jgi:hypothetical protein
MSMLTLACHCIEQKSTTHQFEFMPSTIGTS